MELGHNKLGRRVKRGEEISQSKCSAMSWALHCIFVCQAHSYWCVSWPRLQYTFDVKTSAYIPCVSKMCNPRVVDSVNVSYHSKAREIWTPKQSISEQHGQLVVNPNFNHKFSHPTKYSQSMSSTKLKRLPVHLLSHGLRWPSIPWDMWV